MERDTRRSRGQWRGCYAFENIICDGDGANSPKRSGGLKMGSTYYYYYELDDGTEIHDSSLPSTTSCPYMPGQAINLLWVPVDIQPLRVRSASMSSMANGNVKTLNPADKYMTPRQPPPTPRFERLHSSPMPPKKKRSARSLSPPKSERAQWSPRTFFGVRAPSSPSNTDPIKRGRSSPSRQMSEGDANISTPTLCSRPDGTRDARSLPLARDASPEAFKKVSSRDPSLLRQILGSEGISHCSSSILEIPDEIAEEAEDDDNFASNLDRISFNGKFMTPLSPPPSGLRSPPSRTGVSTDKPLPQLPEESFLSLMPAPIRLHVPTELEPGSHFSTSTLSTNMSSPAHSQFGFSTTPSISDSLDYEDSSADVSSGDEFTYSPVVADTEEENGFNGYSLPDGEYASELTLRKQTPLSALPVISTKTRTTFGGGGFETNDVDMKHISALDELLSEMGYLGDIIVGK